MIELEDYLDKKYKLSMIDKSFNSTDLRVDWSCSFSDAFSYLKNSDMCRETTDFKVDRIIYVNNDFGVWGVRKVEMDLFFDSKIRITFFNLNGNVTAFYDLKPETEVDLRIEILLE